MTSRCFKARPCVFVYKVCVNLTGLGQQRVSFCRLTSVFMHVAVVFEVHVCIRVCLTYHTQLVDALGCAAHILLFLEPHQNRHHCPRPPRRMRP